VVIGIDVATDRLNCVALEANGSLAAGRIYAAHELEALSAWAADATVIAIDAPAALSTEPHAAEDALSPKFRRARCAEIALGRDHGIWVPWTSPTGPPVPGWIATGLELYSSLAGSARSELIEVFPYAAFRVLTRPGRLAKKTSVAGIRQRVAALASAGLCVEHLALWSHDSLDAAVAALVALQRHDGGAHPVTCGHDDSAIWLPAPPVDVADERPSAGPGRAPRQTAREKP
jgi:predicted nuclease with RNAse H fold